MKYMVFILVLLFLIGNMGCGTEDTASDGDSTEVRSEDIEVTDESEPEYEPTYAPEPEPEPEPEDLLTFISIGENSSFADWDYKVIDVELHNTLRDETARGQYIVFMVEATNNANMERSVGRSFFQAEDDESRVFSFDSSASLAHHHSFDTDIYHSNRIGPSFSAILPVAFDIPEDVETIYLYPAEFREEDLNGTKIFAIDIADIN